jgi:hypothetical protein
VSAPTNAPQGVVAGARNRQGILDSSTRAKPVHGAPIPRDIPADMRPDPPIPCDFSVGDRVTYTNDYGVTFDRVVKGFASEVHSYGFVYLNLDCWWMPVTPESLSRIGGAA